MMYRKPLYILLICTCFAVSSIAANSESTSAAFTFFNPLDSTDGTTKFVTYSLGTIDVKWSTTLSSYEIHVTTTTGGTNVIFSKGVDDSETGGFEWDSAATNLGLPITGESGEQLFLSCFESSSLSKPIAKSQEFQIDDDGGSGSSQAVSINQAASAAATAEAGGYGAFSFASAGGSGGDYIASAVVTIRDQSLTLAASGSTSTTSTTSSPISIPSTRSTTSLSTTTKIVLPSTTTFSTSSKIVSFSTKTSTPVTFIVSTSQSSSTSITEPNLSNSAAPVTHKSPRRELGLGLGLGLGILLFLLIVFGIIKYSQSQLRNINNSMFRPETGQKSVPWVLSFKAELSCSPKQAKFFNELPASPIIAELPHERMNEPFEFAADSIHVLSDQEIMPMQFI